MSSWKVKISYTNTLGEKYLGVIISRNFSPGNYVSGKVHKMLGLIANMKKTFTYGILLKLYKKYCTLIQRGHATHTN